MVSVCSGGTGTPYHSAAPGRSRKLRKVVHGMVVADASAHHALTGRVIFMWLNNTMCYQSLDAASVIASLLGRRRKASYGRIAPTGSRDQARTAATMSRRLARGVLACVHGHWLLHDLNTLRCIPYKDHPRLTMLLRAAPYIALPHIAHTRAACILVCPCAVFGDACSHSEACVRGTTWPVSRWKSTCSCEAQYAAGRQSSPVVRARRQASDRSRHQRAKRAQIRRKRAAHASSCSARRGSRPCEHAATYALVIEHCLWPCTSAPAKMTPVVASFQHCCSEVGG
jgi:hypothetical protein